MTILLTNVEGSSRLWERQRPSSGWASHTPAEVRIAEGLTDPQIGEQMMFISGATVKTHRAHIFRKLDVHSSRRAKGRVRD